MKRSLLVVVVAAAFWLVLVLPGLFAEPFVLACAAAVVAGIGVRGVVRRSHGVAIAAGAGLIVILWLLAFAPGAPYARTWLHPDAFADVRAGMSQREVERLLGGPSGNYGRYSAHRAEMTEEGFFGPRGSDVLLWSDDDRRFEIAFVHGVVVAMHERAGYGTPHAPLARLQRLLEFRAIGPPHRVDFTGYPGGDDPRPTPRQRSRRLAGVDHEVARPGASKRGFVT